jgi:hypothetical protein
MEESTKFIRTTALARFRADILKTPKISQKISILKSRSHLPQTSPMINYLREIYPDFRWKSRVRQNWKLRSAKIMMTKWKNTGNPIITDSNGPTRMFNSDPHFPGTLLGSLCRTASLAKVGISKLYYKIAFWKRGRWLVESSKNSQDFHAGCVDCAGS